MEPSGERKIYRPVEDRASSMWANAPKDADRCLARIQALFNNMFLVDKLGRYPIVAEEGKDQDRFYMDPPLTDPELYLLRRQSYFQDIMRRVTNGKI